MRVTLRMRRSAVLVGVVFLAWAGPALAAPVQAELLPYDASNPILYSNDGVFESGTTDAILFALASTGRIDLRAIVTGPGGNPPPPLVPNHSWLGERNTFIAKARRSGFRNIPDNVTGLASSLDSRRPASDVIEDTPPYDHPGARRIVEEAHKASPQKPLVIIVGGTGTNVADAYLLDPSITDRVVVAWLAGSLVQSDGLTPRPNGEFSLNWFNGGQDAWAAYIVAERFTTVFFPETYNWLWGPRLSYDRFAALPDTELRQMMLDGWWNGRDEDADGPPVMPIVVPNYVKATKRFSFSYFENGEAWAWAGVPVPNRHAVYRPDSSGRMLVVMDVDIDAGTNEWWARVSDPAAWSGPRVDQAPYQEGAPLAIPGTIEAEHFDEGGQGRAYWDIDSNYFQGNWVNPIRNGENVDIYVSGTASGGHKVGSIHAGEWIEYSINAGAGGTIEFHVRVASPGPGGTFHLEIDGTDVTGPLNVPDTGGWDSWHNVTAFGIGIGSGVHVARLVMDANGSTGTVGDFDTLSFTSGGSPPPPPPPGGGSGLTGIYYATPDLTGPPALIRTDPAIDFDWGAGSPDPTVPTDGFSIRWSGQLTALYSETYTFHVTSDDGIRLWVNGQLLIDEWVDQAPTEWSGSIALEAGQPVAIEMEYYENSGGAVAVLEWRSGSTPRQIVPRTQLSILDTDGDGVSDAEEAARGGSPAGNGGGGSSSGSGACGATGLELLLILALARRRRANGGSGEGRIR